MWIGGGAIILPGVTIGRKKYLNLDIEIRDTGWINCFLEGKDLEIGGKKWRNGGMRDAAVGSTGNKEKIDSPPETKK